MMGALLLLKCLSLLFESIRYHYISIGTSFSSSSFSTIATTTTIATIVILLLLLRLLILLRLLLLSPLLLLILIHLVGVAELWSYIYYLFAFLKGMLLFTVILLIGSGWSLMKAYLNDKEKKIIFFVLILQVLLLLLLLLLLLTILLTILN